MGHLREQLEADLTAFNELGLLADLADASAQPRTFASLRAQLQLAAKLSPDGARGSVFKASLLSAVSAELPNQKIAAEIRGLRNVGWESFDRKMTKEVFRTATEWVRLNIVHNTVVGDKVAPLICDSIEEKTEWALCVRAGIEGALSVDNSDVPRAVWAWLVRSATPDPEAILEMYIQNSDREARVADVCPSLIEEPELSGKLIGLSRLRLWFELHAAVLVRSQLPSDAMARHLESLPADSHAGLERLRETIGARQFLEASLELKDLRLVDSATKCLAEVPGLWASFDATDHFSRGLLLRTLQLQGSQCCDDGIFELVMANVVQSLDLVIAKDEPLLKAVVAVHPDWSGLGAPEDTWSKVPDWCRSRVLGATADGWLKRFVSGEAIAAPASPELRSYVSQPPRARAVLATARDFGKVVDLFEELKDLPEDVFTEWAGSALPRTSGITHLMALRIGSLILSRRWRSAAYEVGRAAAHQEALRPAIKECVSLLGVMQRLRLAFLGALSDTDEIDLWSALQEVGMELYPYGPGEQGLWQRAGGDPADLPNFKSGRDSWTTLISDSRAGRHDVTIASITNAMLEDFPYNSDVRMIARLLDESYTR